MEVNWRRELQTVSTARSRGNAFLGSHDALRRTTTRTRRTTEAIHIHSLFFNAMSGNKAPAQKRKR
jgi:hypothetical protein